MGNALVDVMTMIDSDTLLTGLNLPKGSMQLVDYVAIKRILHRTSGMVTKLASGGSAANTIHGLANLGVSTAFIGKTGNDKHGVFFGDDMKKAKIEANLLHSDSATGMAIALISPDSERTFATYLGAAAELSVTDLSIKLFNGYHFFHIEGYLVQNHELIKKAVELARSSGLQISLDLASYNVVESNLEFLKSLVSDYVDILFANEEEARAFTGQEPTEAARILGNFAGIAVVKTGKNGSFIFHNNELIKISAINALPVDTTGAGDLYASGFIWGIINGKSLYQCGAVGSLLAGKVIEVIGAKIRQDDWKEIRRLLTTIID